MSVRLVEIKQWLFVFDLRALPKYYGSYEAEGFD